MIKTARRKLILIPISFLFIYLINCGKKGPLQLDPEIFPSQLNKMKIVQEGDDLKFSWSFPEFLKDNKTPLDISQVSSINFYYIERINGSGTDESTAKKRDKIKSKADDRESISAFSRKKRLMRKIDFDQLKPDNGNYHYSLSGISDKFLNKALDIAVNYKYKRLTSDFSGISTIKILFPVSPVTDLGVSNENKVIKLKWSRISQDKSSKNAPPISGYNVFRMIESAETGEKTSFSKLNKDIVLNEYYEDSDSGVNGNYNYYVTAVITPLNFSKQSNMVSVKVSDVFPPEIPQNILIFKSEEGLMISWKKVNDQDLSHYRVYRKPEGESNFSILEPLIKENKFLDTKVKKGETYSYVITSVDNNGNESDNSTTATEQF